MRLENLLVKSTIYPSKNVNGQGDNQIKAPRLQ